MPTGVNTARDFFARLRHSPEIAIDLGLTSCLVLIFGSLFQRGPLFVGDYASASQIDPANQFLGLFRPIDLNSRNAGYGFRPYLLQWELGSSFLISAFFSLISGDPGYAKLVILTYMILGAVGMNHLLKRILMSRQVDSNWFWSASVRTICALFYTLNPAVLQLIVKGYIGILAVVAFLPFIPLAYEPLLRSNSKKTTAVRAMPVAVLMYFGATYTYPLLMVAIAILAFEFSYSFFHLNIGGPKKALTRLSLVFAFAALMELPGIYVFSHESASKFLSSFYSGIDLTSFYYASSGPASLLRILTLTTASWQPSYFEASYSTWYEIFVAAMLSISVSALLSLSFHRLDRWKLYSSILLLASVLLTLGANFPPNLWIFQLLPIFPEAFQFVPLVAFSLVLLITVSFVPTTLPRVKLRVRQSRVWSKPVAFTLLAVALVSSAVPLSFAASTNLSPNGIPDYDREAYAWLAEQPGDGRIFLIPPSYAVKYNFESRLYAIPVDYWTISPPKPMIIDNGGDLRGIERILPYALYSGKSRLLDYLLTALAVKYVVLRGDAVSAWDVPYYRNITSNEILANFPFLEVARNFGPINIYANQHFQGLFSAYRYPIIVQGNITSLVTLSEILTPGTPVLFTDDLTSEESATVLKLFASPVLLMCGFNCSREPTSYSGHSVIGVSPYATSAISVENAGWRYVNVILDGRTTVAIANQTLFQDNFENATYTDSNWSFTQGRWQLADGQYMTYNDSYQPYSLVHPSTKLKNFVLETEVNVKSGYGAGIFLNGNSSLITDRSYQVQLIPSSNTLLLAQYRNGSGVWIDFVKTPLSYDTNYKLALSFIHTDLEVLLNGRPMLSEDIPDLTRDDVGLIATQADATFSDFKIFSYDSNATSARDTDPGSERSVSVALPENEVFLGITNHTKKLFLFTDSILNTLELLEPDTASVDHHQSSPSSWTFSQNTFTRAFLVARFRYTNGWSSQEGTSSYRVYGFEVGFDMGPRGYLSYDIGYSYAATISFGVFTIALFSSLYPPASLIVGTIRGKRKSRGGYDAEESATRNRESSRVI